MSDFTPSKAGLVCESVPLAAIARETGTPVYVYSSRSIRRRYQELDTAFGDHPHAIHYALKANSTLAIVRLLRELGSGADANSGGEIEVALRAGFAPGQIVFTGVGKTADELERAVALGLCAVNAESPGEIERLDAVARAHGTRVRVALRINPDVDAGSHPNITTGVRTSGFGVPIDQAAQVCRAAATRPGLELVGLHVHIGSQITVLDPLVRAAATAVTLARELRDAGLPMTQLDFGGGLGISYDGGPVPAAADYAVALVEIARPFGATIVVEPGRMLVGPAGVLVARVVDVKGQAGESRFVVLDAGMTELMRPALYGAYHRIEPVAPDGRPGARCDVVGPLCESSDVLGRDRVLPDPAVGDLVAVLDSGAYGAVMASNYNRRPMPAEVLVDGGNWRVIRRRQALDDLLMWET